MSIICVLPFVCVFVCLSSNKGVLYPPLRMLSRRQLVWSAQGMASEVSYERMGSLDSLRNIVRQVYKEKGLKGFWQGAWPEGALASLLSCWIF